MNDFAFSDAVIGGPPDWYYWVVGTIFIATFIVGIIACVGLTIEWLRRRDDNI